MKEIWYNPFLDMHNAWCILKALWYPALKKKKKKSLFNCVYPRVAQT